ncbi:MAG: glycosyltransferase family 4 protein, partial [Desulfovibrionaceae bacterium]|nr:glycosyltransferase family 4 protein [Desulfovibrionaceae bacterium]
MTRKLNILFLLEDLCYGGTQRQTLELARRLDRTRFLPSMLTLTGPTDLDAEARQAGVDLFHLGKDRAWAPFFFWRLGGALRRAAPDILVPCTALPNIWGRIWGNILRLPVVLGTCRGGGAPLKQHERLLWRLTRHMICNSEALRDVLQGLGVPEGHISYIPNGVNTEYFRPGLTPLPARRPLLLCVARLVKDKDHLTLLRAFERIVRHYPEACLRLVGDGPEEAVLKRWAEEHPAGRQIEFVPGGADMRAHYAEGSVFVLSSQREGQPNVILEAMSAGLPVCATAVGGIPRLVEEGASGLLSPAGDAGALAENCLRLLKQPALAEQFGNAGRRRVEQYHSFQVMVEAHQNLFVRLWK